MTAPFSFPKLRREAVGAARFTTGAIKLCVLPRIAYNATAGVQPTRRNACRAVRGGFLTWAAKPKVRESPKPRKFYFQKTPACFTSALSASNYYGGA